MKKRFWIFVIFIVWTSCKSKDDGPLTTDEKNWIDTASQKVLLVLDTALSKQCVYRHDSLLHYFQDSLYNLRKKQILDEMNSISPSQ